MSNSFNLLAFSFRIGAPVLTAVTALALATPVAAQNALQGVEAAVEQDYDYLDALYTHLHRNPELSYQEKETSRRMAAEMRTLGFDVTEGVGGYGVVGVMKNGEGPTLLIRADMDGLPVLEQSGVAYASRATAIDDAGTEVPVMHACAHDIHMTVFVGTARRLAAMKDHWAGTLVMIAQPAEERGGGAKAMLEDGLFERFPKPDYNLAMHSSASMPAGDIGYARGWALANVDSVDILVRGIGGHGAYPHTTKDPIVIAAQIINALQTIVSREVSPLDSAVVTVGSIHGGFKHNIIGNEVKMQLTVRSYSDATREKLLASIKRIAENTGRVAGLPEDMLPQTSLAGKEYTPATFNDEALSDRVGAVLRQTPGVGNVSVTGPVMGGEDFSRYSRTEDKIPSMIFWLGGVNAEEFAKAQANGEVLPSLHSPFFAPDKEPMIKSGVNGMVASALDLLRKD